MFIDKRLSWWLDKYNLLSTNKFAFRSQLGNVDSWFAFNEDVHNPEVTIAVMKDLKTTFDRIPPSSLM